jgi:hypothetical protein
MKQGIAVVAYDCRSLRVLPDCKVKGSYGYLGMTVKQQVIRLKNSDEIKTNLPFSGASLGAKLGAELSRGATLDVALVMVGKKVASRAQMAAGDLTGTCQGATHFVRSATLGAFVMKTGTQGKAAAAAEFFGVGGSASSSSDRDVQNRDGDPKACQQASPNAPKPPDQCGALVRLHLSGVGAAAQAGTLQQAQSPCPAGYVFSGGKCTTAASAQSHQCDRGDLADCMAQCDRRHAGSCSNLAVMLLQGRGVKADLARALALMNYACRARVTQACGNLGTMYFYGKAVERDIPRAISLLTWACDAGDAGACGNLGSVYYGVGGLPRDIKRATQYFNRGCTGGNGMSCSKVGALYEKSYPAHALTSYIKGCGLLWGQACFFGGRLYAKLHGEADGHARTLHALGCQMGHGLACAAVASTYLKKGEERQPAKALPFLERGCRLKHTGSCGVAGMLLLKGGPGLPKDVVRGISFLERSCRLGDQKACAVRAKVGGKARDSARPAPGAQPKQ